MTPSTTKSKNTSILKNKITLSAIYGAGCMITVLLFFKYIPVLMVDMGKSTGLDSETGTIGDTFGGTLGPIIGLIAAILTFMAFYVQYEANQQQQKDLKLERFENKFFEMLRLHKENVNEMVIEGYDYRTIVRSGVEHAEIARVIEEKTEEPVQKDTSARKIFVTAFTEFLACRDICSYVLETENFNGKDDYVIKMAYLLIYHGVDNEIVTSINSSILKDKDYLRDCKEKLLAAQKMHEDSNSKRNRYPLGTSGKTADIYIKYKPFSGHGIRFGHYFRHLFQMVKFVVDQPENLIETVDKRQYLRMLRAQLSDNEQLFLYLNYLGGYGAPWEKNNNSYFSDFRMIHNLPIILARKVKDPHVEFEVAILRIRNTGEEMFMFDEKSFKG